MKNALELSLSATRLMVGDPPSSFALDDSSIPEDAALGTVVGTLSATDADGGSVLFSIGDQTVPFAISGDSLIVAGVLDFDTQPSWQFYIQAMGSRGGASLNQVTVTVTSVTETPNPDPLPPPVVIEEDGDFTVPTTSTQVNDAIKIHGKKGPGTIGKVIYDIGPLAADDKVTLHWTFDGSLLALQGRKVAVGLIFKQGNAFHFIGLQGNGSSGSNVKRLYGSAWNQQTGITEINDGAPLNGSQYDAWVQIEVDSSGDKYTFRTATDPNSDADFDDEVVDADTPPITLASGAGQFGVGLIFQGDDAGPFSCAIDVYQEGEPSFGDPNFGFVVFQTAFEGPDGSTASFTEESNSGHTVSLTNGRIEQDQKEYGSTSFFTTNLFGVASCPASTDFALSAANSDKFCIEFSIFPPSGFGTSDLIFILTGGANSIWVRLNSDGEIRFLGSKTGAGFPVDITTSGAAVTALQWNKICCEKDATGKIRIYKDGVMKGSATPADSILNGPSNTLAIGGNNVSGQNFYIDNVRIMKGQAPYASDSGYTPATGPFPDH